MAPLEARQVVMELCGCWLSDEQYAATDDRSFVLGFDEKTTQASGALQIAHRANWWRPCRPPSAPQAKREAKDELLHLDMREAGSLGRRAR